MNNTIFIVLWRITVNSAMDVTKTENGERGTGNCFTQVPYQARNLDYKMTKYWREITDFNK